MTEEQIKALRKLLSGSENSKSVDEKIKEYLENRGIIDPLVDYILDLIIVRTIGQPDKCDKIQELVAMYLYEDSMVRLEGKHMQTATCVVHDYNVLDDQYKHNAILSFDNSQTTIDLLLSDIAFDMLYYKALTPYHLDVKLLTDVQIDDIVWSTLKVDGLNPIKVKITNKSEVIVPRTLRPIKAFPEDFITDLKKHLN